MKKKKPVIELLFSSFDMSNHGVHEVMILLTLSHLEADWRSCEMSSLWVKEFRYCKRKESNIPAYTVLKMHQSQPGPLGMAVLKDVWNISKNTFLYITSLKWEVIFMTCLDFMQMCLQWQPQIPMLKYLWKTCWWKKEFGLPFCNNSVFTPASIWMQVRLKIRSVATLSDMWWHMQL